MSDNDTKPSSWTDREVLIYLFSAIEYSNVKIDYANAPAPPGRNTSGCAQKMGKLKKAFRRDIDALKGGSPASEQKAPVKTKRKADDGAEKPKKRSRAKKALIEAEEIEGNGGEEGEEAEM